MAVVVPGRAAGNIVFFEVALSATSSAMSLLGRPGLGLRGERENI